MLRELCSSKILFYLFREEKNMKKNTLSHRINFSVLFQVENANPNADPGKDYQPRTTSINGLEYGIMRPEIIKHEIRDVLDIEGLPLYIHSGLLDNNVNEKEVFEKKLKKGMSNEEVSSNLCASYWDCRAFGCSQTFKVQDDKGKSTYISVSRKSPIAFSFPKTIAPVVIYTIAMKMSTNIDDSHGNNIYRKSIITHGLYRFDGTISCHDAARTGFTDRDAEYLKHALLNMFRYYASESRQDGSISVQYLAWWEHNSKLGQYCPQQVFDSLHVTLKDNVDQPYSIDDYNITIDDLSDSRGRNKLIAQVYRPNDFVNYTKIDNSIIRS